MGSTVSNTVIQNPTDKLVTIPVMDFMKSKSFISCHKSVRANANGYPYVTFINDKNVAENIYFSKATGEKYKADQGIEKGFFNSLAIAETTNADGEIRIKLVCTNTTRLSLEDLF